LDLDRRITRHSLTADGRSLIFLLPPDADFLASHLYTDRPVKVRPEEPNAQGHVPFNNLGVRVVETIPVAHGYQGHLRPDRGQECARAGGA
jgi:hypothetical protein